MGVSWVAVLGREDALTAWSASGLGMAKERAAKVAKVVRKKVVFILTGSVDC